MGNQEKPEIQPATLQKKDDQARIGTFCIAKSFGRKHEHIIRLVKKYQDKFQILNALHAQKVKTKGRPIKEYLLAENQYFFLGTLLKNNEVSVNFKLKLIKLFKTDTYSNQNKEK